MFKRLRKLQSNANCQTESKEGIKQWRQYLHKTAPQRTLFLCLDIWKNMYPHCFHWNRTLLVPLVSCSFKVKIYRAHNVFASRTWCAWLWRSAVAGAPPHLHSTRQHTPQHLWFDPWLQGYWPSQISPTSYHSPESQSNGSFCHFW